MTENQKIWTIRITMGLIVFAISFGSLYFINSKLVDFDKNLFGEHFYLFTILIGVVISYLTVCNLKTNQFLYMAKLFYRNKSYWFGAFTTLLEFVVYGVFIQIIFANFGYLIDIITIVVFIGLIYYRIIDRFIISPKITAYLIDNKEFKNILKIFFIEYYIFNKTQPKHFVNRLKIKRHVLHHTYSYQFVTKYFKNYIIDHEENDYIFKMKGDISYWSYLMAILWDQNTFNEENFLIAYQYYIGEKFTIETLKNYEKLIKIKDKPNHKYSKKAIIINNKIKKLIKQ